MVALTTYHLYRFCPEIKDIILINVQEQLFIIMNIIYIDIDLILYFLTKIALFK